jgi:hypothetical protein
LHPEGTSGVHENPRSVAFITICTEGSWRKATKKEEAWGETRQRYLSHPPVKVGGPSKCMRQPVPRTA